MTKAEINQVVSNAINTALPNIPDTQTLSETENVEATDAAANVLATVNPVHSYPPKLK